MASRSDSKRARLEQYLAEKQPAIVDETIAGELNALLAPVSAGYLRTLLRRSGIRLAPMVEGANADSLDDLERTLLGLAEEYANGRRDTRPLVIEAKGHLRWAEVRAVDPEQRSAKAEMLLWTMTWLENPIAFPVWARLRRGRLQATK